jgi:Phage portal protein, SPP1 Gp6-like
MPDLPPLTDLVKAMEAALDARAPAVELYDDYYNGIQRLSFATAKYREAFGRLLDPLSDNWCQLVVDASVERLKVEGFRFGPTDQPADEDAWAMWQANYLDADQALVHTEASKSGVAYVMVLPSRSDPETPRITVEHPAEVITYSAPDDRRTRLAGFKRWALEGGGARGVLYTPGEFIQLSRTPNGEWTQLGTVPNPIGPAIPVVPMLNLPNLLGAGLSDLQAVVSLQDAINKLLADMLVNSEFVAYPQRYVTGLEIPTDPATGRALDREEFLSSTSRLWLAENKEVRFGELAGNDGLGYVRQIEALVQHIAAQTRTPPHYLLGQSGAFPSGESLKATETGLVAKVKRKQLTYGETWEEAMRLGFAYRGDTLRAQASAAETVWADPESRSTGELVDALVKMVTSVGMPLEVAWRLFGASPQEVQEWRRLKALPDRPAFGQTPPPPPPSGAPAPPSSTSSPTQE